MLKIVRTCSDRIATGALLAVGIVNSGVRNECDPALALLSEYLDKPNNLMRIGAILGYALSYSIAKHILQQVFFHSLVQ